MKKIFLITFFTIILLGAGLRFYNLGSASFDRDEFFELNTSYGYFKTGQWLSWDFNNEKPFEGALQDDTSTERAEVFRWQLAQIYRFAEPTEANTRAVSALWGVISVILIYFVVLSFTGNKYIALIAAFLTAVGESEIIYGRRLRMYAMFFPVYLFFSWMLYKFYEEKYQGKIKFFQTAHQKIGVNLLYFLPAVIAGLVSLNVHFLTVSVISTILAYSFLNIIFINMSFPRKRESSKQTLVFSGFRIKSGMTFLKQVINKYSISILIIVSAYVVVSRVPFLYPFYKSLKKNVELITQSYGYFGDYFSDFVFPAAGFILVLAGTWYLAKKINRVKPALFLFASAFAPLGMAIFTWSREPAHRYIYFIQSFGIILAAAGIFGITSLISEKFKKYKKFIAVIILVIFLFLIDFSYFSKKSEVYWQEKDSYYPNFSPVFSYVDENRKEGDILVTRAYRGFYFRGWNIPVFDTQILPLEKDNCQEVLKEIVGENRNGWIIFPKVDKASMCREGRDYLDENLGRIKISTLPSPVLIYRWKE